MLSLLVWVFHFWEAIMYSGQSKQGLWCQPHLVHILVPLFISHGPWGGSPNLSMPVSSPTKIDLTEHWPLGQRFSSPTQLTFEPIILCFGGCPVHCSMFSSILDLYWLDASSIYTHIHTHSSHDNKNVSWRHNCPWLRTTGPDSVVSMNKVMCALDSR